MTSETQTPAVAREVVVAALEKVASSAAFQAAARSRTLLRFVVEHALDNEADRLKEYTLGVEALGRDASFDPRSDPIVRAEASRLRARLEQYYAAEGASDPLVIVLAKGSYVPRFRLREQSTDGIAGSTAPAAPGSSWTHRLPWVALGTALGTALGALAIAPRMPAPAPLPVDAPGRWHEVELRSSGTLGSGDGIDAVVSPDSTRVVFVSRDSQGVTRLNALRLDQPNSTAHELPGTEGARGPFFSPDGQWVGFWAPGWVKKTAVDGGAPVRLAAAADFLGASWSEDTIIAATSFGRLMSVPTSPNQQTTPLVDLSGDSIDPRWPQVLPGAKYVLFTAVGPGAGGPGPDRANIEVLSLADGHRKTLARAGTFGRYLSNGHLTYVNQGTLYAQRFDLDRMEVSGDPIQILNDVQYSSGLGFAQMDVSATGTLLYRRSVARGDLILGWVDRHGSTRRLLTEPGRYMWPRLSPPDGRQLAFTLTESAVPTIRIVDPGLQRERQSAPGGYHGLTWSPDGRFLVVGLDNTGLYWMKADDPEHARPLLSRGSAIMAPSSFSDTPAGFRLAYHEQNQATAFDIWTVPIEVTESGLEAGTPEPFLRTSAFETYPSFSPDGRWLAYASGAYGKWQVYVRSFPDSGVGAVQVSRGGGRISRWLPNGRELVYRTDDQRLMVVTYRVRDGAFVADPPREWTPVRLAETGVFSNFDPDPGNGDRVLALVPAAKPADQQSPNHVTLTNNFLAFVRQRLAGGAK